MIAWAAAVCVPRASMPLMLTAARINLANVELNFSRFMVCSPMRSEIDACAIALFQHWTSKRAIKIG
jgi:hypothetical protein